MFAKIAKRVQCAGARKWCEPREWARTVLLGQHLGLEVRFPTDGDVLRAGLVSPRDEAQVAHELQFPDAVHLAREPRAGERSADAGLAGHGLPVRNEPHSA